MITVEEVEAVAQHWCSTLGSALHLRTSMITQSLDERYPEMGEVEREHVSGLARKVKDRLYGRALDEHWS